MRQRSIRKNSRLLFILGTVLQGRCLASLPGGNSEREPPDSIPNSEVKTLSADGSVGSPHVRVGHRQALIAKGRFRLGAAFFYGQ